jgi:hypothetical protein
MGRKTVELDLPQAGDCMELSDGEIVRVADVRTEHDFFVTTITVMHVRRRVSLGSGLVRFYREYFA